MQLGIKMWGRELAEIPCEHQNGEGRALNVMKMVVGVRCAAGVCVLETADLPEF